MNKRIKIIVCLLIGLVAFCLLCACNSVEEAETPKYYKIEFNAVCGRIEGQSIQNVLEGGSTQKIVAVPDEGYYFDYWSDLGREESFPERIINNVCESRNYVAIFSKKTVTVTYSAGNNGSIKGDTEQSIKFGENTIKVTAVPDKGYRFKKWSDGLETAERIEKNLKEDKALTAIFEIISNDFTYNYKFATSNCNVENINLTYGKLNEARFIVPQRAHCAFEGWYADKYCTVRVTDKNGNLRIGNEIFDSGNTELYAKWKTQNTETFKILMVYVTEVNALLPSVDRQHQYKVSYKMSETEREISHMITQKLIWVLNDLAISNFEVDEYFTSLPVTEDQISYDIENYKLDNKIDAYDLQENIGNFNDYDSVLTSFSFEDYKGLLHNDGGAASCKFAHVHFDGAVAQLAYYGESIESLLNPLHYYWDSLLEPYLHELSHTIELSVVDMPDYHNVVSATLQESIKDPLIASKRYLTNNIAIDGKSAGIPYDFWERKIVQILYEPQVGGYVNSVIHHNPLYGTKINNELQYVICGGDAMEVVAKAFSGYEFIGWSDGLQTATRRDLNITEDLHVFALFRKLD